MKDFYDKYVKPYRKYFITAPTTANTFLLTGAIIKELKNPRYKVFRYPGKELPKKEPGITLKDFETATKIVDFIVLSKTGSDIVITYPMQLLYLIDPETYNKYRNAPTIDLNKYAKNRVQNNKEIIINEKRETEKFLEENKEYILTNILYSESLAYYPLLSDIIDGAEFEKYIVIYPESKKKKVDTTITLLPPEERVKEANQLDMTVLFLHTTTNTPLTTPIGTFIIFEPEKAIKLWQTAKKISPGEFVNLLQKRMLG